MHDHEQQRSKEQEQRTSRDDAVPGRASASAALDGPASPVGSGITKPADGAVLEGGVLDLMRDAERSPGEGLPGELRGELEQSFGADLGGVRVHTGAESHAAAGALGAQAYTLGSNIHFANGAYAPDSASGRGVIAHEVAHVVQSGGSGGVGESLQLSSPADAHEVEAHELGAAFAAGAPLTAPTQRTAGVGRALVSRVESQYPDPVVTPKHDQGKASAGVSGKISNKKASISPTFAFTRPLAKSGSVVQADVTILLAGTGTLEWPDPGGPTVEAGGGAQKSSDGKSEKKVDGGIESTEIPLWVDKIRQKATDDQTFWEGFELESPPKLVASAGRDHSIPKSGPAETSFSPSVKVEAKCKNGLALSGSVTVASLKSGGGEFSVSGPSLAASAAIASKAVSYQLSEKITAKANLSGSATVVVKPNWTELAKEVGKLFAEMGVAGAVEFAAITAVAFAPALVALSALSMIEDENQLFGWAVKEAIECRHASVALRNGTALGTNPFPGMRSGAAFLAGLSAAKSACVKQKITEAEYKAEVNGNASWQTLSDRCLNDAARTFFAAVNARADEVYEKSISLQLWRDKAHHAGLWREKASLAWKNAQTA